jgi:hypothetical protein
MTYCGGQIAEVLLSEAARMALFCRLNKGSKSLTDGAHPRTFWVIYSIEKLSASCQGRTSVSTLESGFILPDATDLTLRLKIGDSRRRYWLPHPFCTRSRL